MISIRNLLFLAVAVTGSVIKRDASTVLKDLETINSDTSAVTEAVNNYHGGSGSTASILSAQNKLTQHIKTATNNAKGVKPSDSEADKIISFITDKFQPNIRSSLNALTNAKDKFKKDGLAGAVKSILQALKSDSSNYSDALIAGTPGNKVEKAKAIKDEINKSFDDAIHAFS